VHFPFIGKWASNDQVVSQLEGLSVGMSYANGFAQAMSYSPGTGQMALEFGLGTPGAGAAPSVGQNLNTVPAEISSVVTDWITGLYDLYGVPRPFHR
jgi:hypothetical protein